MKGTAVVAGLLSMALVGSAHADTIVREGGQIQVNDGATSSPYPSSIQVEHLLGPVESLMVTLQSVSHGDGDDLDVLLVGPHGHTAMVLSDACGGPLESTLGFSDLAAGGPPVDGPCPSATYTTIDYNGGDPNAMLPPAPQPNPGYGHPQVPPLFLFHNFGHNVNGIWSLYVQDDTLNGSLGSVSRWSLTFGGKDLEVAPVCDGKFATLRGTRGNDLVSTTAGPDVIVGLGGNDRINGLSGNDRICGGLGNDILIGGEGNDRIFGGPGKDRMNGSEGRNKLVGGKGRDVVKRDTTQGK